MYLASPIAFGRGGSQTQVASICGAEIKRQNVGAQVIDLDYCPDADGRARPERPYSTGLGGYCGQAAAIILICSTFSLGALAVDCDEPLVPTSVGMPGSSMIATIST
jgi:hypothetical protein